MIVDIVLYSEYCGDVYGSLSELNYIELNGIELSNIIKFNLMPFSYFFLA